MIFYLSYVCSEIESFNNFNKYIKGYFFVIKLSTIILVENQANYLWGGNVALFY